MARAGHRARVAIDPSAATPKFATERAANSGELRNRDTSPPGRWTGEADVLPWQAVAGGFRRRGAHVGRRGVVLGPGPGPDHARAQPAGARAGRQAGRSV